MKKIVALSWILFLSLGLNAQISVQNYRMQEQQNWNSNIHLSQQQLKMFKAGILNNNEVTLDVDILMNVEATDYTAVFNVRQVAETAVDVNVVFNDRLSEFLTNLKKHNVTRKDVVVEIISQVPIYGLKSERKLFSKTDQEVPIGFELHKNISVSFTDYDLLNEIVFEASKSEIYDLIKVDYFAKNPFAYYDTMRHAASQYLKALEANYITAGFPLDTFTRILAEKTGAVYPISRYSTYKGLSQLSYDKLLKKAGGTVVPTLVSAPSMYYNPLPFTDFDVVIRPRITRPSIQYTLNVQVKLMNYPKSPKGPKVEKQFFMITPEGNVKMVDVVRK